MVYHSSAAMAATLAFQSPLTRPTNLARTPSSSMRAPAVIILDPFGMERRQQHNVCCQTTATSSSSSIIHTHAFRRRRRNRLYNPWRLRASSQEDNDISTGSNETPKEKPGMRKIIEEEVAHAESLEEFLDELEALGGDIMEEGDDEDDDYFSEEWNEESLEEIFQSLPADIDDDDEDEEETYLDLTSISSSQQQQSASLLENALLQGVVPADAGVGSNSLPGDYDFDPLNLATKDYFPKAQAFLKNIIPLKDGDVVIEEGELAPRPKALILRDYREAEIRHSRLAMLAAMFWPLQELLDQFVLSEDKFDSILHSLFLGGVTLPYFPLLMTAIMLLLGYLDIYSQAIKDVDKIGEAFLPGDCFWDPLQVLTGAPDQMKRNMQERELFNGRFAMLAIAVFIWEEATTGKPLVTIEGNEILFEPVYQVPFIQTWLDSRFFTPSPFLYNLDGDAVSAVTSADMLVSNLGDSFQLTFN